LHNGIAETAETENDAADEFFATRAPIPKFASYRGDL
jgi:hypothetical protein